MNRLAGIIVAVVGVVLIALSVLKVTPGLIQTGVVLILLGALMIGLSFVPKPENDNETPRMSTAETLTTIFYSPGEVFQNLRRHPRWLAAMLIMSVMSGIYFNLFLYRLTPERVTNFAIDKTLEIPMLANNEEAKKGIEAGREKALEQNKNPVLRTAQVVNSFVGQVYLYAFLALIFFVFALAMGGTLNYWQAFSAAVYAGFPVAIIKFILSSIILFLKDPVEIHPVLGQSGLVQDSLNFLVDPSKNAVIYTILGTFSLLMFYWLWLNATGLKNAGEKVSSSIAWTSTLTIYAIIIVIGVVTSYFFSGFMS